MWCLVQSTTSMWFASTSTRGPFNVGLVHSPDTLFLCNYCFICHKNLTLFCNVVEIMNISKVYAGVEFVMVASFVCTDQHCCCFDSPYATIFYVFAHFQVSIRLVTMTFHQLILPLILYEGVLKWYWMLCPCLYLVDAPFTSAFIHSFNIPVLKLLQKWLGLFILGQLICSN